MSSLSLLHVRSLSKRLTLPPARLPCSLCTSRSIHRRWYLSFQSSSWLFAILTCRGYLFDQAESCSICANDVPFTCQFFVLSTVGCLSSTTVLLMSWSAFPMGSRSQPSGLSLVRVGSAFAGIDFLLLAPIRVRQRSRNVPLLSDLILQEMRMDDGVNKAIGEE